MLDSSWRDAITEMLRSIPGYLPALLSALLLLLIGWVLAFLARAFIRRVLATAVDKLSGNEAKLYKKWRKALRSLAADPLHPGLNSHEITALSRKYGKKVFESYLENRTPGAGRMFWAYGPGRAEITILALEPHPEPGEYGRVRLDDENG